jgi:UDP-N-acetylmuramate dehydrogenase
VLVADEGFDGLVVLVRTRGRRARAAGGGVLVDVAAGEDWDALVAWSVERGYAGLECLSGIPGRAGAAPIQNVGAYGQEVAEVLEEVRVWDRSVYREVRILARDCAFAYRHSRFKEEPDRFAVLGLRLRLRRGPPVTPRYREVAERLPGAPSLADIRDTVLDIRRSKGMVYDKADPLTHGAGSFFVNPVVDVALADALAREHPGLPRFPVEPGRVKLTAGWLIEHSGLARGERRGQAAISPRHALALVNLGGARARDVADLARAIQAAVLDRFGVDLVPEPRLVGL